MHSNDLIPVVDHPNLVRDRHSRAIVDTDDQAYANYQLQKQARRKQEQRISQLEETINKVETDISDIKSLLTRLLEK
jgi:septal ring factor EnvC (AmiA/AmiB activator)